jgi:hypothetical protein
MSRKCSWEPWRSRSVDGLHFCTKSWGVIESAETVYNPTTRSIGPSHVTAKRLLSPTSSSAPDPQAPSPLDAAPGKSYTLQRFGHEVMQ